MRKNLKRPRGETDDKLIVDEFDKIYENGTDVQLLIFGTAKENEQSHEILKLKKRNEKLTKKVEKLIADSRTQKKKIQMLRKNNKKKWKLLTVVMNAVNEEEIERYEELEKSWSTSEESADESAKGSTIPNYFSSM